MDRILARMTYAPARQWTDIPQPGVRPTPHDVQVREKLPAFQAMTIAGNQVATAILESRGHADAAVPVDARDAAEFRRRARWVCVLLFERESAGDDPAAGRKVSLGCWYALASASPEEAETIDALWRILVGKTPLGSQPLDWQFVLARWLLAPLIAETRPPSAREWRRIFCRGGVDRGTARRLASAELTDAREAEAILGHELWSELRRSERIHPIHIAPIAKLIVESTGLGRALLTSDDVHDSV